MQIETEAIVCAVLKHGENGAIVRMLTPDHGLVAAYVHGARGRHMRAVLIPGNLVSAKMRARTEAQLLNASVELSQSRAPILSEPLPSALVDWATALVASALPERQPYPRLHVALSGLLDAVVAAPSAQGWSGALARFERLVLSELGYGSEEVEAPGLFEALRFSGQRLFRDVLSDPPESLRETRTRLIERMKRALVRPSARA